MIETAEKIQGKKDHRREFLLLLAALELRIAHIIKRDATAIVGQLLMLSDDEGNLPATNLNSAKVTIDQHSAAMVSEILRIVEPEFYLTATKGMENSRIENPENQHADAAVVATQSIMAIGALGVPFFDWIFTAMRQAVQNAQGIVGRSILGNVKVIAGEVLQEYTGKLAPKVSNELNTQLNAVFVEATRAVAELSPDLIGFEWMLSLLHDSDECDDYAGFHDRLDDALDKCGRVHPNCRCWLKPVYKG